MTRVIIRGLSAGAILFSAFVLIGGEEAVAPRSKSRVREVKVEVTGLCYPAQGPLYLVVDGMENQEQPMDAVKDSDGRRWHWEPKDLQPIVRGSRASIRFGASRSDCTTVELKQDPDNTALDIATFTFSQCYKPARTVSFEADPPTQVAYRRVFPHREKTSVDCDEQAAFQDARIAHAVMFEKSEMLWLRLFAERVEMTPVPIDFVNLLKAAKPAKDGSRVLTPQRDLTYAYTVQNASGTASAPTLSSAQIDITAWLMNKALADSMRDRPDSRKFTLKLKVE